MNKATLYAVSTLKIADKPFNTNAYSAAELLEFQGLLDNCANYLNIVMKLSYIQLLFPLIVTSNYYFTYKTKRKTSEIGVDFLNELILFTVVVQWRIIR